MNERSTQQLLIDANDKLAKAMSDLMLAQNRIEQGGLRLMVDEVLSAIKSATRKVEFIERAVRE